MIKPHAVRLVTVYFLRGKEGLICQLRDTVISRNICELFVFVEGF